MVQPINYMSQIPQPDLGQSLLSGLQLGTSIREIQEKRVASEQAEAAKVAFKADFQNAKDNPTQENWLKMIATYPQYREAFSEVRKGFGEVETQKEFDAAYPISTALDNGRPEIASKLTVELIAARKNAKLPTQIYEQIFNEMELGNFKGAQAGVNYLLTNTNPERFEKFTKARVASQAAPDTLRKTEAEADKFEAEAKAAGVTAEFARPLAQAQLDKANKEKLAPSVQEALDFANLTAEQQKTFSSLQVLKKPAGAVTNVNVTNLEKTAEGELGKLVPDLYNQANSAATQLTDLPRYRKALGLAITGPLANVRLDANRIGEALGFTGDKKINATRELIQGLSEMALKSRSMLTGQGAITDREQALLLQARSGDISFSKGELDIIFNVAERAANAQYTKSKKLLSSAATKSPTAQLFLDNVEALPGAGVLNPAEQTELDALRARFPRGRQ